MPFRLLLARKFYDGMVAQALAERPNECCGVLGGVVEEGGAVARVVERYALVNAADTPRVEYLSEPRSMFTAVRDMTRRGLDIVAVYHSHPTSAAIPSGKDLDRNFSEEVVHFIVSLTTEPPTVRGWWLSAREYDEAEWQLVAEPEV
jgi:proteasome lid subunit RPN8/RPN11